MLSLYVRVNERESERAREKVRVCGRTIICCGTCPEVLESIMYKVISLQKSEFVFQEEMLKNAQFMLGHGTFFYFKSTYINDHFLIASYLKHAYGHKKNTIFQCILGSILACFCSLASYSKHILTLKNVYSCRVCDEKCTARSSSEI